MGRTMASPSRGSRIALGALLATLGAASAGGCDDATTGPGGGTSTGSAGDGGSGAAGQGGSGAAGAAAGGSAGAGASGGAGCLHDGALGEPCEDDCDCAAGHACRGLPGERICSVACESWDGCASAETGCAEPFCDLNVGACRCVCSAALCPEGVCVGSYCVGCGGDEHCSSHTCGSEPGLDEPRCRLDTESCTCGGECGDGVCDEAEQATHGCPADCASPCIEGALLVHSCTAGELVPWCRCDNALWQCIDPTTGCPGDTLCQQQGGQCVDVPESCYSGAIGPDPLGCSGLAPHCCLPTACTGPGLTYPPGTGLCCPGLRALDSAMPTPGMDPEIAGVTCFTNCWQYSCAPCGDGVCQPHLTENACNCPEDCPAPPYPLVCSASMPGGCGRPFCRQEGGVCHEELPSCGADHACTREVHDRAGLVCDPIAAVCVEP